MLTQKQRDILYAEFGPPSLGLDVARQGDDLCVWALVYGNPSKAILTDLWHTQKQDFADTAAHTKKIVDEYRILPHRIILDTVGMGVGVFDILKNYHNLTVTPFVAGARPTQEVDFGEGIRYSFANLRAQAWWNLREMLDPTYPDKKLLIYDGLRQSDRLLSDLTAIKYEFTGERVIRMESKKATKKRLGRSPDFGDAIMQACSPSIAATAAERMNSLSRLKSLSLSDFRMDRI